jgi:hypothetical protein
MRVVGNNTKLREQQYNLILRSAVLWHHAHPEAVMLLNFILEVRILNPGKEADCPV